MSRRSARNLPKRDKGTQKFNGTYFYIFCNGETERNYFEDIRKALSLAKASCRIISSPYNRLSLAKKVKEACQQEGITPHATTRVFVVYDADIQPKGQQTNTGASKSQTDNAYHACLAYGYTPIVSNECVELWVLLHFRDVQTPTHRDTLIHYVGEYIAGYHKTQSPVHEHIMAKQDDALHRANTLALHHRYNEGDKNFVPSRACPFTNVYVLVQAMYDLA